MNNARWQELTLQRSAELERDRRKRFLDDVCMRVDSKGYNHIVQMREKPHIYKMGGIWVCTKHPKDAKNPLYGRGFNPKMAYNEFQRKTRGIL